MRLALLCFALALPACKTVDPFLVTKRSLDEAHTQFKLASDAMQAGARDGTVKPEVFLGWAEFSKRWVPAYEEAVKAEALAEQTKAELEAGRVWQGLANLAGELLGFYNRLKVKGLLPPGAP